VPVNGGRQSVDWRESRGVVEIDVIAFSDNPSLAVRGSRADINSRRTSQGLALKEGDSLVKGIIFG